MVSVLQGVPHTTAVEVVERIVKNDTLSLTNDELIRFILGVATIFEGKEAEQTVFFEIVFDTQAGDGKGYSAYLLEKKSSPLLIAVDAQYDNIIPALLSWIRGARKKFSRQTAEKKGLVDQLKHAIMATINQGEVARLEQLYDKVYLVEKDTSEAFNVQQASELLWHTVENNKNPAFIDPLVKKFGADINVVGTGKRTPLMVATINKNLAMAQALIDAGANVKLIVDPAVGSALQFAIEHKATDIYKLLEKHGAREDDKVAQKMIDGERKKAASVPVQTNNVQPVEVTNKENGAPDQAF
jgi:hypothetical protein